MLLPDAEGNRPEVAVQPLRAREILRVTRMVALKAVTYPRAARLALNEFFQAGGF